MWFFLSLKLRATLPAARIAPTISNTHSAEQPVDRFAAIDDLKGAADRAEIFLAGIDLQRLADRAEQVGNGDGIVLDLRAVVGRCPDHLPAADAPAGNR